MILFIVPKNSGLKICRNIAEKNFNNKKILMVRGEDVPIFVEKFNRTYKKAIGITGEDLYKEFLIKNSNSRVKIIKSIDWSDKESYFGSPSLCLLGPKDKKINQLPRNLNICINKKYSGLAEEIISRLEKNESKKVEKIYLSGATEEAFENGLCNLIIDIVYSGNSAQKAGLEIYEKITSSNIVIIGDKKIEEIRENLLKKNQLNKLKEFD